MKRKIVIIFFIFLLSACAHEKMSKQQMFPDMYNEKPLSVLVLPPMNQSTAADAKEYYSTTLAEPLSYMGFYVLPIEVVAEFMKNEGAYDTEGLVKTPAEKFKQYFGADAVLYTTITDWNTSYYVIGGHVTVGVDMFLRSTSTGKSLWAYKGVVKVDTSGNSGNLLAKILLTAIKTATQDYVPVARIANAIVISTMPTGKYHPRFGQDMEDQVLVPKKKEEEKSLGAKEPDNK